MLFFEGLLEIMNRFDEEREKNYTLRLADTLDEPLATTKKF